jgi:glycosyltransferase involved in cell wall biosynthesis
VNPKAGGAEAVTFEIARRLVAGGDSVEWFGAKFPGAPPTETIDGVRITRQGTQSSVHWAAFRKYRRTLADQFDVVVDQVNTVPFFTPLWSSVPVVMWIHQLAREVWWFESPFPVSALGFVAEPVYLQVYRNTRVITVSQSTRRDLIKLGFRGPVTVVNAGVETSSSATMPRSSKARFLYVGRLSPSKRVHDLIRAFAIFNARYADSELRVVGTGSEIYRARLMNLAGELGVANCISFLGHLPSGEKHGEMAEARALVLGSVREGWGLVVIEANTHGTPAIAYDVPGLRDSIQDGKTGLLVKHAPNALAAGMEALWTDPKLFERLSTAARDWSSMFSFDRMADEFRRALTDAIPRQSSPQNPDRVAQLES